MTLEQMIRTMAADEFLRSTTHEQRMKYYRDRLKASQALLNRLKAHGWKPYRPPAMGVPF